jgi:two-component system cell cycle response regulator
MNNRTIDSDTEIGKDTADLPILFVEDSATTAMALAGYLSDDYALIQVRDGAEAWDMLNHGPAIGLIITDLNMPNMSGQELLSRIRESTSPHISSLPVIIMTGAGDTKARNEAFRSGASDFITKPVDQTELKARVNVHYTLARTIRELEASRAALARQATTDPLTGLPNRRSFLQRAEECLAKFLRYKTKSSIIMLDVDLFKQVNDEYGHEAGDDLLRNMGNLLYSVVREVDTAARIGGEEFAILLPDTNRLGAATMAERLRAAVDRHDFLTRNGTHHVTISAGIATLAEDGSQSVADLMRIADKRLYLAKQLGRNRIAVNDEGKTSFA